MGLLCGSTGRRHAGERRLGAAEEERCARAPLARPPREHIAALRSAVGGDAADILEFQLALIDDDAVVGPVFGGHRRRGLLPMSPGVAALDG